MERVLDPARIEAFAERAIAPIRLPDRRQAFSRRGARLRQLSASERAGEGGSEHGPECIPEVSVLSDEL